MKIFLSPSNQTENVYAAGNTNESVVCGKIGEALKTALTRCGFDVKLIHDEDLGPKVSAADAWGADYYIPIHTNAHNGRTTGTRIFYYSEGGKGYQLAKAIFNRLAPLTPGTSEGVSAYPGLYEIRMTKAPTAYIEVDFHDVPDVARWLINNTEAIAEAICKGVCDHCGYTYKEPAKEVKAESLYRVQLGAFTSRANAEAYLETVKKFYPDAFIKEG